MAELAYYNTQELRGAKSCLSEAVEAIDRLQKSTEPFFQETCQDLFSETCKSTQNLLSFCFNKFLVERDLKLKIMPVLDSINSLVSQLQPRVESIRSEIADFKCNKQPWLFESPSMHDFLASFGCTEHSVAGNLTSIEYNYFSMRIYNFKMSFKDKIFDIPGDSIRFPNRCHLVKERITRVRTCWYPDSEAGVRYYNLMQFQLYSGEVKVHDSDPNEHFEQRDNNDNLWLNLDVPDGQTLVGLRVFGKNGWNIRNLALNTI